MTPDTNKILSEKNERIGRIIFNNPERRNAMSLAMWQATKAVSLSQYPGGLIAPKTKPPHNTGIL